MTVVTLEGYTPPPRYPPSDRLWTQARIEESPTGDTPWTTIEPAFTLNPTVSDPANPATYNFTTAAATLPTGWYRVVWIDSTGAEAPTEAVHNGEATNIRPTIDDVAALLASRTTDANGVEAGTFTNQTRPTAAQVETIIDQAMSSTIAALRWPVTDEYASDVRDLIALQAALLIESSFYRGELDADDSVFRQYQAMYLSGVQTLRDNLAPLPIL
jgi:hypothetical protein